MAARVRKPGEPYPGWEDGEPPDQSAVKGFFRWLNRLTCPHDIYIISPDSPIWRRCIVCGKPRRI